MLITIGLFFGIQTQFAHFQFGCYIKNRENRNSCFGLFSFSRVASLLFGPGKGMAESFILLSSYQRNFTVFALLTRLLLQMDAILDQNVMAFITPELPRIRKKKILICILFSYIFLFFLKVNTHILKTHFVMEPFAVAAWRHLPSVHPVFKILFPHLRSVMAINNFVRHDFVTRPGVLQLLKKSYKKFKFSMLSLPEVISTNGVEDAMKLPKYFYR